MSRKFHASLFCCLFLLAFFCACVEGDGNAEEYFPKLESTLTVLPAEAQHLSEITLPACVQRSDDFEIAYVTRVIDGDSIEVEVNGEKEQVRYIGMNTPEYYSKERAEAEQATRVNQALVEGRYVLLIRDVSDRDKYDRLLRYVFTTDGFVNYELVKEGVAEVKNYPPDTACHEYLNSVK